MHMLKTLFFIEAYHQFLMTAEHIAGSLNNRADHLSRNQLEQFFKIHKTANSSPSYVDPCILQWLLHHQQEWTSPACTHHFNIFVQGISEDLSISIEEIF